MFREQVSFKKNDKNLVLSDEKTFTKNYNGSNTNLFSLTKTLSNRIKTIELVNHYKISGNNRKKNLYNSNLQKIENNESNELFQTNNYQSNQKNNIFQLKIDNLKNTLTPPKNIYKSAAEIELKYELMLMEKDKIINKLKEEIEYYKKLLNNLNSNKNDNHNKKINEGNLKTPIKNYSQSFKSQTIESNNETIFNESNKKSEKLFSERLNNFYTPKANDMLKNFIYNNHLNLNLKNSCLHRKMPSNSITSTFYESNSLISNHKVFSSSPKMRKNNSKKNPLSSDSIITKNNNLNDYKDKLKIISLKVTKLVDKLFKYVK
jgi:hypothetical protein